MPSELEFFFCREDAQPREASSSVAFAQDGSERFISRAMQAFGRPKSVAVGEYGSGLPSKRLLVKTSACRSGVSIAGRKSPRGGFQMRSSWATVFRW